MKTEYMRKHQKDAAGAKTPVRPDQIETVKGTHFWESFGHYETENAALWIVRHCQAKGGWVAFKRDELSKLANEHWFNFQLLDPEFLVASDPEAQAIDARGSAADRHDIAGRIGAMTYQVTNEFVERCFKASPKVVHKGVLR